MKHTLDEIYGCDFKTYLQAHGKQARELIEDVETDIKLLMANKQRLSMTKENLGLYVEVDALLQKKLKHLKRLKSFLEK